jgi:hypothetical protein
MTTPKSKRAAPTDRSLDQYTLYHIVSKDVGVVDINDDAMDNLYTNATGMSFLIDLGFSVNINNTNYTHFIASGNGFMWLLPKNTFVSRTPYIMLDINDISSFITDGFIAYNYDLGDYTGTPVLLLAPWATPADASFPFQPLEDRPAEIPSSNFYFLRERTKRGFEPASIWHGYRDAQYETRSYLDVRSNLGKRHIVRWNLAVGPAGTGQKLNLKFDAIIYENGRIEFRYDYATFINVVENTIIDTGFCGIIASGTVEKPLFRDFSYLLNYHTNRQEYNKGGTIYDPNYSDKGAVYGCALTASVHWPAGTRDNNGSMFVFLPPVNIRKINRGKTLEDSSLQTYPQKNSLFLSQDNVGFDDQKTLTYNENIVVNMPTTLNLYHGGKVAEIVERQNIFTTLEVTSSTSKTASDSFLDDQIKKTIKPFHEFNLFESERNVDFFVSGSNTPNIDTVLGQNLSAKDKISLSFPISYFTTMPGLTSSIYYLNVKNKQWCIPQNTTFQYGSDAYAAVPLPTPTKDSDLHDSSKLSFNGVRTDPRGFNAFGSYVSSGTIPITAYNDRDLVDTLTTYFSKSVALNYEYTANDDETFTLPITTPFLLEKMVIQIPMALGKGWFSDQTTVFYPINSINPPYGTSFDLGGPMMTVSLMHQYKVADSELGTRRNIILSGTITHIRDDTLILSMSSFEDIVTPSSHYYLRPVGIRSFNINPTTVVAQQSNGQFTGSVQLNCEAAISNGFILRLRETTANPDDVREYLSASTMTITSKVGNNSAYTISYVNPIGRAGNGFNAIDGRSHPGGDFRILDPQKTFINPLYKIRYEQSGSIEAGLEEIAVGNSYQASVIASIPLFEHTVSPYLVMPGDKLVLSLSKMRPFRFTTESFNPTLWVSGSNINGHDVKLITGSVQLTFYGSQIKENAEFHDARKQNLFSNAIHEVAIGNEPVLDQFQVENIDSFVSSMNDDYITGSLLTLNTSESGVIRFTIGERSKLFSKRNAQNIPRYTQSGVSYADALRPWYQFAGMSRVSFATAEDETYYDSLVPDIQSCVRINGSDFITYEFFYVYEAPSYRAFIVFNSTRTFSDNIWLQSFPFESRYNNVIRQKGLVKIKISKKVFVPDWDVLYNVSPREFVGINISIQDRGDDSTEPFLVYSDTKENNYLDAFGSIPLSDNDAIRVLYGFGDLRLKNYYNGVAFGANNLPTFSTIQSSIYFEGLEAYAPVIRGWKYGLISGIATNTKSYWNRQHYGQFRDMFEQRPNTKFLLKSGKQSDSPISVRFVTSDGKIAKPENTWSSNLSFEATSSLPYFDGEVRNRGDINTNIINQGIVLFNDDNGNPTF